MKYKGLLLFAFCIVKGYANPVALCDSAKGLELLSQVHYVPAQVEMILKGCDQVSPGDAEVLLLHGLLARDQAKKDHNFKLALDWLEKAHQRDPNNTTISQELAATYELAHNLSAALPIYQMILAKDAAHRGALLGTARIYRLMQQFSKALSIYDYLLASSPGDVEALNGLAWVKSGQNQRAAAIHFFQESLKIQPYNPEALKGLKALMATNAEAQQADTQCNAAAGLVLLKQTPLPISSIQAILEQCKVHQIDTTETRLLQGLLARTTGLRTHEFKEAIFWLQKAMQSAQNNDPGPALELAVTYEWDKQLAKAKALYEGLLIRQPTLSVALLGKARVLRTEQDYKEASKIYDQLLQWNKDDIDALNGLGWIALSKNNFLQAEAYFNQVLTIEANNPEALIALQQIKKAGQHFEAIQRQVRAILKSHLSESSACDANLGLLLLNKKQVNLIQINAILRQCDRLQPQEITTLMLHGLLARQYKQYQEAIRWFTLAQQRAGINNTIPLTELAVTYEWDHQPKKALAIYEQLLFINPQEIAALLGQARVLRALYDIQPSIASYNKILQKNPKNIEALTGLGESLLADYQLDAAKAVLQKSLALSPHNPQTQNDIAMLNNTTKNMLGISGGHYSVPPQDSDGLNVFYFRNLNATDGLTLYATHNTKQIESGFGTGPTLLPNNSVLLGYQHLVPQQYGWQVSYDARQHDGLPFEHRVYGLANIFITDNFQWFNALRIILPNPWNTQLFISGVTAYTPLPFDITLTGFWAQQQIGGKNETYALDFSKEYSNRLFYNVGPSYLPREDSWEIHGRVIVPTFKNQALVAEYSHYFFNKSTFATLGWRFYWA